QSHVPQPRAPLREAECLVRHGRRPVLQRRLLEVLQAVEMRRDPVTAREHLARDLGVAALVGIEERADLQGREPGGGGEDPRPPAEPAAAPPVPQSYVHAAGGYGGARCPPRSPPRACRSLPASRRTRWCAGLRYPYRCLAASRDRAGRLRRWVRAPGCPGSTCRSTRRRRH